MGKRIAVCLVLSLLLTGCRDQLILERLGFTQSTSYDLLPDGRLKISVSIPKTDPESTVRREILSTVARTSKEGRLNLSRKTNLILVSGQLRTTLYGLSLAKSGLWSHLDTLQRDPTISPRVKVVIVNGEASQLLEHNFSQHPRTGQYIDRLLEKESNGGSIPRVTLYDFVRDYYDDGIDPVAPIVVGRKDNIEMDGIALFKKDKYRMRIEPVQVMFFALARGKVNRGEMSIDLTGKEGTESVMLDSVESTRKLKATKMNNGSIGIHLQLSIRGAIREYIGKLRLAETKDHQLLEEAISRHISKQLEDIIRNIQKHGVDSLGFGKVVRNSLTYKEWKALDWNAVYPRIAVKLSVGIQIKDQGKLE
ncbi:Ger(x)C family spore germination protein [Paenibacillus rigui]|uniref:Spore gernimation protein GerC n=1 Tax=Paenibacillus rigui TaxID=554312 RepID=A0A229UU14_9BACL|nr:Ger(x)C family spore germination protein [Paenibacillus rigui]OXM86908.1 spore gernimation protein GerC [Paenibacillus rigui]